MSGYPIQNALFQWEEGLRDLEALGSDPRAYRAAARVVDAIREELRRRIGPTFMAGELAQLYGAGTDWCTEVVFRVTAVPPAEPQTLADAAFALYLRGAQDYAGGRHLTLD